jgi:chemotaxis protein methyltransferase CheR
MPAPEDKADALSAADLIRLSDFLYRKTGMLFGESKRYYIERRVAERMTSNEARTFNSYFALLRSDSDETEQLINSFTVNETYFYREEHQLRCLSSSILPEIIKTKRPGDRIRIWSVPCASGEEPYSIAIWLLENWALVDAYNVEIVGSDIDTAMLVAALNGSYGRRALDRLSPELVARYFHQTGKGSWEIIGDLKESVSFRPVNLVDAASVATEGRFEVIFCRNVLIYFDEPARVKAIENLGAALMQGGFLCLGHTESISRASPYFAAVRYDDAIVYRRTQA